MTQELATELSVWLEPHSVFPKGQRAYGKVLRNRGKNTTLIAAITLEGAMSQPMTVEGATEALAFEAYVG